MEKEDDAAASDGDGSAAAGDDAAASSQPRLLPILQFPFTGADYLDSEQPLATVHSLLGEEEESDESDEDAARADRDAPGAARRKTRKVKIPSKFFGPAEGDSEGDE
jgi:hypothetical protein